MSISVMAGGQMKDFDPDLLKRRSRNFTKLSLLYLSIVFGIFLISAYLFVIGFKGIKVFKALVIKTPDVQFFYIKNILIKYWKIYIKHYKNLSFTQYNYFAPKLLFFSSLPFLTVLFLLIRYREFIKKYRPHKKGQSLYGDAHWATPDEIKSAKLREKKGVLIGKDKNGFLVAGGYQHLLLFAPTGSGKGVGFMIPNCLFWHESMVVHDPKLENFDFSSGYRVKELKQKVYVWEPANQEGLTHAYNPLDWVSKEPSKMVDDVSKLSSLLLPKQDFWVSEARTLLNGMILWILVDDTKQNSFGEIVRTLRSDDFDYFIAVALDTLGEKIHPIGYMNLSAFSQKADKEKSGVKSHLSSAVELWGNPIIDASTAKSDFNPNNLKKELMSIFVGATPNNLLRLQPLLRMFYQQITEFLSAKMPGKDEPYGCLFLMDEFPTVGKMEQFLSGIAYFRGYRVRLFLVVQDTQQLKSTYEDSGMNSFLSNCTYRITYAANNIETARLISDLLGTRTVESSSYNKPKFFDFNPQSRSQSISASQRNLMQPHEVIGLPKSDQIILIEAVAPIRTKKIIYYSDKFFTARLLDPISKPTQEIKVFQATKKPKDDGSDSNVDEEDLSLLE